ncbi:MAG: hypothetical protein RR607_07295, partial [Akkermansia sp.]
RFPPEPFSPPLYFSNTLTNLFFFSIYPAVSPPLGVRWEPDATLRFAPLTQHVLPLTPSHHKRGKLQYPYAHLSMSFIFR